MKDTVRIGFVCVVSCMLAGVAALVIGPLVSKPEKCPATGWEVKRAVGHVELQAEIDAVLVDNDDGCITPRRMRKVLHDLNSAGNPAVDLSIDTRLPDERPPSATALREILTELNK